MISITQNLESSPIPVVVDPDCATRLREWNVLPPSGPELNLSWHIAASRGAVKDRLLRDKGIRIVLIAAASEADPLLRDLARNSGQLPSRAWLHIVLLTAAQVTIPLLAQLKHFGSWSVLTQPCNSGELADALGDAVGKSAEQHRLAMLSAAIRAEAEDILVRTRNIVGALRDVEAPAALGNLVRIADRLSGGEAVQTSPILPSKTHTGQGQPIRTCVSPALSDEETSRHWTRSLIDLCSARQNYFPDGLFSDPAWDMLLDLTYARLAGKRVSVSSLCIASRVPATTALRRIGDLVSEGLATRVRDEADGRRVFVQLTEDGFSRMLTYIDSVRGMLSGEPVTRLRKA